MASKEEKTPFISPSMIKKAARYWEILFSMTSHAARMTSIVMKVVSMINGMAIPSTPK